MLSSYDEGSGGMLKNSTGTPDYAPNSSGSSTNGSRGAATAGKDAHPQWKEGAREATSQRSVAE